MKFIATFIFLTLTTSLVGQTLQSTELDKTFTKEERADLYRLTEFFQKEMCDDISEFERCMDSISTSLVEFGWIPILENVSFPEQKALYETLKTDVFNEIWSFCEYKKLDDNLVHRDVCLNWDGRYRKFLQRLAKKNGVLKAYLEDVENGGDFGYIYRLEHEICTRTGRIDPKDDGIKLVLTVYYLTQNDQHKRNEIIE